MKTVYQAFDGEIFDTRDKCIEHDWSKCVTDIELYGFDKHTGELYKLEFTCDSMDSAPIIVIKSKNAATRLQEYPWRSFPQKAGIYTCGITGCDWVRWNCSIDELQNDLRARIPWQEYLNDLTHWVLVNKYSSLPCNLMSYDEWLSKEYNKEDNSNDR